MFHVKHPLCKKDWGSNENFSIPSTKVRNIFLVFGDKRAFILLVGLFYPVGWDMLTAYKVELSRVF